MYSRYSTVQNIEQDPVLLPFKKIIQMGNENESNSEDSNYTLEQLCSLPGLDAWNPDVMADGYNFIYECAMEKKIKKLDFYSDKECKEDPTKKEASAMFFPSEKKGPFVIICAGGGYFAVANPVEGFPVAKRLNQLGIGVAVLKYRIGIEGAALKAREDLNRLINYMYDHMQELNIEDDYMVIGFSAGGHLAAGLGTENLGWISSSIPKPGALCLCYALVNFDGMTSVTEQCISTMFPEENRESIMKDYTPILHVGEHYVKTYIWQTKEDEAVSIDKNALAFYDELKQKKIPVKLKIVEHGAHGLGIATGTEAEGWLEEAVEFWKEKSVL